MAGEVHNWTSNACTYDPTGGAGGFLTSNCINFRAVYFTGYPGIFTPTHVAGGVGFVVTGGSGDPTHLDKFKAGFVCTGPNVSEDCFADGSNATTSYRILGSHTRGIDISASITSQAIFMNLQAGFSGSFITSQANAVLKFNVDGAGSVQAKGGLAVGTAAVGGVGIIDASAGYRANGAPGQTVTIGPTGGTCYDFTFGLLTNVRAC